MKSFENASVNEVEEVVTETYVAFLSNSIHQAIKPNVPEMLYSISREWFIHISKGHLSPIDSYMQDRVMFCSKALNELINTGCFYKLGKEEN